MLPNSLSVVDFNWQAARAICSLTQLTPAITLMKVNSLTAVCVCGKGVTVVSTAYILVKLSKT
jgi:hypothetical protein